MMRVFLLLCLLNFADLASSNSLLRNAPPVGKLDQSSMTRIPIRNNLNLQCSASITIGTPPQKFNVFINTISPDLWVPSTNINFSNPFDPKGPVYGLTYKSSASSTHKKNMKAVTIDTSSVFGKLPADFSNNLYKVSGILSSDTVSIAGLTWPNQIFAEITNETGYELFYAAVVGPIETRTNGVLGLGLPNASSAKGSSAPFFQNLMGRLSKKTFGFWFNSGAIDADNGPISSKGELTLGGIDSSRYVGKLAWTRVTTAGDLYWQIAVQYFTVGSRKLKLRNDGYQMIVYLNFPKINGPRKELDQLASLFHGYPKKSPISNDILYAVNCSSLNSLPDITFTISGANFVLTPSQYLELGGEWICSRNSSGIVPTVFSSIGDQTDSRGNSVWILGSPFIQQFYAAFDYENKRVGFAHPAE